MKKALLTLLLMISSFVSAQTTGFENQVIADIDISITTPNLDNSDAIVQTIKSRMKSRVGDIFSQTAFDADLKLLVQDYDHIDPKIWTMDEKIYISLNIWPNPVVRSICWSGNKRVATSTLQSELGVGEGAIFDKQTFIKGFQNIRSLYIKKGYFEAEISYTVDLDELTNEVEINFCIDEGRAGKIKAIGFKGFTKCEQREILDMMVTKKYNFFVSWLTSTGCYNDEMIQHDQFQILNYIQNKGFADAHVNIEVEEVKGRDQIYLCISVDRGEMYRFGNITFTGNTLFTEEELKRTAMAKWGDPYSADCLHDTINKLTNCYGRIGYIESAINYEPKIVPGKKAYDIEISIDEGSPYCVGMIKIVGNCSTETKVILHETLLVPGEVFNLEKLQLTERRLCNMGYFSSVNVFAVKSEDENILPGNFRDVHIEVEETNTGNIGAFSGYSTDQGLFGGINITESNFNHKGLGCFFRDGFCRLRGGGEYLHLTLSIGSETTTYGLSWTKPYFCDTLWSAGFDIDRTTSKRYISNSYDLTSYNMTLHATYEYNAFMRLGTHYRLSFSQVDASKKDFGSDDKKDKVEERDGTISAAGASWNYDSTNHPLTPTCGKRSRFQLELAGIGGEYQFLSTAYLNTLYYDAFGCGIFKIRADARFIQPLKQTRATKLPISETFFLGGDNTIRGFRPYRPGPKFDKIKNGVEKTSDDPEGGVSLQIGSVEYIKPIISIVDAFAYFDMGAISENTWEWGATYMATGLGLKVQIFPNAPPLTVGYGFPIGHYSKTDVKQFFINVGGKF